MDMGVGIIAIPCKHQQGVYKGSFTLLLASVNRAPNVPRYYTRSITWPV